MHVNPERLILVPFKHHLFSSCSYLILSISRVQSLCYLCTKFNATLIIYSVYLLYNILSTPQCDTNKLFFIQIMQVNKSNIPSPRRFVSCSGSTTCVYHSPFVKHFTSRFFEPRINRSWHIFSKTCQKHCMLMQL